MILDCKNITNQPFNHKNGITKYLILYKSHIIIYFYIPLTLVLILYFQPML